VELEVSDIQSLERLYMARFDGSAQSIRAMEFTLQDLINIRSAGYDPAAILELAFDPPGYPASGLAGIACDHSSNIQYVAKVEVCIDFPAHSLCFVIGRNGQLRGLAHGSLHCAVPISAGGFTTHH
jgi:hypothetical protein